MHGEYEGCCVGNTGLLPSSSFYPPTNVTTCGFVDRQNCCHSLESTGCEDGGNKFLQNDVKSLLNYTMSYREHLESLRVNIIKYKVSTFLTSDIRNHRWMVQCSCLNFELRIEVCVAVMLPHSDQAWKVSHALVRHLFLLPLLRPEFPLCFCRFICLRAFTTVLSLSIIQIAIESSGESRRQARPGKRLAVVFDSMSMQMLG
jgi:hypothetical protein